MLGLRMSTYYPNINLSVLLTQYGTFCQVYISCLGSYCQRGKTPRVYYLATGSTVSRVLPVPCSGNNSSWDFGQIASLFLVSWSVFSFCGPTMKQALGLKFCRKWDCWIKVCFSIKSLLDVNQVGNFLVEHTSVPPFGHK